MNIVLTSKCRSHCKFCFMPASLKNRSGEMTFEQFKIYFDHIKKLLKSRQPVGILGGEPTAARDFPFIITYAKQYKAGIRLYSNLIADKTGIKYIANAKNIVLIWNANVYLEADKKNKKIISGNLKLIAEKFNKKNIIASFTLPLNFEINKYKKIIPVLKKYNIKQIRVALDSTNHQKFIALGAKVFDFCKFFAEKKFELISVCCGHFLKCMFDKRQEEYLKKHIKNFNYNDCSQNFPVDVFFNGKVYPCMGLSGKKANIELMKYKTLNAAKSAIQKQFFNNIKNSFCIKCKDKTCGGFCKNGKKRSV